MTLKDWVFTRLEPAKDLPVVIVRDPLSLAQNMRNDLHTWGKEHLFAVLPCATNLLFRWKYEEAKSDETIKKILVLDQTPLSRRQVAGENKATVPFYPDLLVRTSQEAQIDLDLRQYLKDVTRDPNWPIEVNDPKYSRLILKYLDGVLQAHHNLKVAQEGRFTDQDFKTIVAFAALGIPDTAFRKLDAEDYWRVGLLGHEVLEQLKILAPEIIKPINDLLQKAPPPFCWFTTHEPVNVIRAFYLSTVMVQHLENWNLLLANIDPVLAPFTGIEEEILKNAAPKLIDLNPRQAELDLEMVEKSLEREKIQLLVDQLKMVQPLGFTKVIEDEFYSTFLRSLALLLALEDLLKNTSDSTIHERIANVLFPDRKDNPIRFVDVRTSVIWTNLKEAYKLTYDILPLRKSLDAGLKELQVIKNQDLDLNYYYKLWNEKRINRIEYYLSALERLVYSSELLVRGEEELPSLFVNTVAHIQQKVKSINKDINRQLDEVNIRFQEMVRLKYPSLVASDENIILTSGFLKRCLKPYWDPVKEKAVVLVFDGMRYDIWEELLRPMLADNMEVIVDLPALSLLPSETHVTRKAICAGTFPDEFDMKSSEDKLLKKALTREFSISSDVKVLMPQGSGTGETVRYRAGNLDVFIFEFCDKELHRIQMKTLPDGSQAPSRPLAFIYQQHLKNIIDTEVSAIVRNLTPGTKVFVTADHGFGRVGRQPIWFKDVDLNEASDCTYQNSLLKFPIGKVELPGKIRENIISFTPQELRMPKDETRTLKSGQSLHKKFEAICFPKIGYSFSRNGSPFNPDTYSHGGISLQELIVPMVVLKVKSQEEGLLLLGEIKGQPEVVEGETVEFRMRFSRSNSEAVLDDLRVDVDASYSHQPEKYPLSHQVIYVSKQGMDVIYQFVPSADDATDEERIKGVMERTLNITISYREGYRIIRKSRAYRFNVQLNTDRIIRRGPAHLTNILGLMPKGMRN